MSIAFKMTDITYPTFNKAGYTATKVMCGWVGVIFEVTYHLGRSSEVKEIKS